LIAPVGDGNGKREIQGSLHCGGKSAAFGRDDVLLCCVAFGRYGVALSGKLKIFIGSEVLLAQRLPFIHDDVRFSKKLIE
jgi:hypothetical protein